MELAITILTKSNFRDKFTQKYNELRQINLPLLLFFSTKKNYNTSCAKDIILEYPLSRNSRAIGPKIREPRGSSA